MSGLELYLFLTPLVLVAVAAIGTYVFFRILDRKHPRAR